MTQTRGRTRRIGMLLPLAIGLGACRAETAATSLVNDTPGTYRSADVEAVVGPDGQCLGDEAAPGGRAQAVRLGITECDLVRLQGKPQDVVIADMPDGRRRVEMFYPGTGGTTRGYTFIANRLVSTPPGTLKE